jgi:hypothetical protein
MPNGALALAQHTHSAITTVADFDATTWTKLLRSGPRPAAYVFTNSFCATCPEAFDALQKTVVASGKPVPLAAILMDVQGERALAHAHHYAGVTKIYAFDGFEPAIRQAVDPAMAQYHALCGAGGSQRPTAAGDRPAHCQPNSKPGWAKLLLQSVEDRAEDLSRKCITNQGRTMKLKTFPPSSPCPAVPCLPKPWRCKAPGPAPPCPARRPRAPS